MSLVTYEKSAVGDMWKGLVHLDPKVWRPFEPGDWVIHRHYDGHGMVVAVDDVEICVLW